MRSIVEIYDDRIMAIARRIHAKAPWRIELEDLVQQGRLACLVAAAKWEHMEHRCGFWGYARILVHGEICRVMFKVRRDPVFPPQLGAEVLDPQASPEVCAELNEHLRDLGPEERELLHAFILEEQDCRSFAAQTGMSKSTAHRRFTQTVESIQMNA